MRTDIPAALLAVMRSETPTTALLWRIVKNDDTEVLGTDHDDDIEIDGFGDADGVYIAGANITGSQLRGTADFAVDNMEVGGATPTPSTASPPELVTIDVNVKDIEAGLFSKAPVYVYLVNWADPTPEPWLVHRGYLGDISRDSDGKYATEFRGVKQLLQQVFVRTYSERCQVHVFGDDECKFDVEAIRRDGEVTAVTNRRRFDTTITTLSSDEPVGGYYDLGVLRFTSGENDGIEREVRRDNEGDVFGHVSTWDQFPNDVHVGDTFTIIPGCNRTASTCAGSYNNIKNFRGYGIFIEGVDALMRGPS